MSVSIVTMYDVISSRWSSHFWVKLHVFFFTFFINSNNSKTCGWNHAKCSFMCYFSCQAQKITISNFRKNGGQNDDHCWWRRRPPAAPPHIKYTLSCWENQRPSTKGKIAFLNTATYYGGSMNLRARLRVNSLQRQTFVSEKRQQS